MTDDMNEYDVIHMLRNAVQEVGSQKEWAEMHSVSPQHVNDVLRRRRAPGKAICQALGIVRVVLYRRAIGRPA